ncbi:MAG: hypothetical protein KJO40_12930 [Deltaproteobacteria bacterium]|nr:hypothetical protein [Deltaproteobacteria bacterium]NND27680.1 hypothetical protein [Myxococcales bacterium]MBT8464724.1 hypothetical protein [Deltaproteobacteria bacterium]MBT8482626.1 hypothetical protein [Deltaproteobacteria bacterium]NNK08650.1 hypothetical protein [Myxococcales bacterium]
MRRFYSLAAIGFVGVLGSCNSTGLPTAPNLQPVLDAYANPTVEVTSAIMASVADRIAKLAEEIGDSEIFEEILNVVIDVQMELQNATPRTCNGGVNNGNACADGADCPDGTCDSTGDLVLGGACSGGTNDGGDCANDADCPGDGTCAGGVTVPSPTGAIQVNYICSGWDERQFDDGYDDSPDSANGSIDLFMTLDSGGIGRVVWGTAIQCRYLVPNEGDNCEASGCSRASYNGSIALDLGPDWVDADIERLPVTFVVEGTIGLGGSDFRINQSFRVILAVESGLVILVDIGDPALTETFNYFFVFEALGQGIRDATGVFGCSLEENQCFDRTCDGGANDGSACTIAADCPEGTCVRRTRFSW